MACSPQLLATKTSFSSSFHEEVYITTMRAVAGNRFSSVLSSAVRRASHVVLRNFLPRTRSFPSVKIKVPQIRIDNTRSSQLGHLWTRNGHVVGTHADEINSRSCFRSDSFKQLRWRIVLHLCRAILAAEKNSSSPHTTMMRTRGARTPLHNVPYWEQSSTGCIEHGISS